ncbi:hypothetical protein HII31_03953 [Pseudocercospora fuligena]|uniref:Uncharacterized protein n=1 Tax=Pseudocercospora fuligena TaxID=685502 RepID=A0A8H6RR27_9PEZI|nr:hypothetical protein HII31_03953 [Pseudocercospora fuligena]
MACSPSTEAPCAPPSTGDTTREDAISPPGMTLPNQSETPAEVPPRQASGDSEEERPCAFLGIPAELRNRIYREALVPKADTDRDTISISPGYDDTLRELPPEPPLLRTCKQIREEATSIYEQENQFFVELEDFDVRNVQRWWSTFQRPEKVSITIVPV